jgi:hypothetical protein
MYSNISYILQTACKYKHCTENYTQSYNNTSKYQLLKENLQNNKQVTYYITQYISLHTTDNIHAMAPNAAQHNFKELSTISTNHLKN